jgi:hypothetical protein
MMLFAHSVVFVGLLQVVALAHAAAVVPAVDECQTIGSGILSTFVGVDSTLLTFTMTEWVVDFDFRSL